MGHNAIIKKLDVYLSKCFLCLDFSWNLSYLYFEKAAFLYRNKNDMANIIPFLWHSGLYTLLYSGTKNIIVLNMVVSLKDKTDGSSLEFIVWTLAITDICIYIPFSNI